MRSLLAAAVISFAFTLFLTPVFLKFFRKWGWGQVIRTPESANNPKHEAKRGTLSMGGLIFILGTLVGYLVAMLTAGEPPTVSGLLVLWLMVGFGVIGFIDDYMKISRSNSLGLSGWRKVLGQILVLVPFGIVALNFPNKSGVTPGSDSISLFRDISVLSFMALTPILGWLLYLLWISLIGVATSNATNLTDGLDGLAAGSAVFVIGTYSMIAFFQYNQRCEDASPRLIDACYGNVRDPLDLAIVSAAFVGSLVGFLWWNAPKAKVFMGDTGSLAIGGVLTAMAILTHTQLLLIVVGFVFLIGPGSVILQRYYFKLTKGKRLFLNSPFHHHLEMRGWPEPTIVVRMWIIAGACAVTGLALFYVEWLSAI